MGKNLPVVHPRYEPPNPRKARNENEAIAINEYHDEKVIVMANLEKEEWIIAPNSYGLDMMR